MWKSLVRKSLIKVSSRIGASKKLVSLDLNEQSIERESLCRTCSYALVRKDADMEEVVLCTYGSILSEISCVVVECSGYNNRYVEHVVKVAGYIKPECCAGVTVIRIPLPMKSD